MKTIHFDNPALAAEYAVKTVETVLRDNPEAVFCFAAGHSSLPVFEALVEKKLDFSSARFIELDEWLGLDTETPGSCTWFLKTRLFSRINAQEKNIFLFKGANPDEECRRMEETIAACGGIDYILLGAGMNGHLALNEPGSGFDDGVHIAPLSKTTLEVAPKYFPQGMPPLKEGITLGLKTIRECRHIQLLILGRHKRDVARRLLSLTEADRDFPASALLNCSGRAELLLDVDAAG